MQEKFFNVSTGAFKKAILFVALCAITIFAFAQDEEPDEKKEKGFQKEKLFVGGNFGLTFGNYTLINVSPQIGYRFTDFFAAGVGLNLQYVSVKQKDFNGNTFYKTSRGVAGLNVFGRMYPIRQFMIQVQPEVNYVFGKEIYYDNPRQEFNLDAQIVPSLLLGGGLVIPSGRGAFITSVFYDVLQDPSSPYGKRLIVNFTYNIGL
jgi:hypothetical protein